MRDLSSFFRWPVLWVATLSLCVGAGCRGLSSHAPASDAAADTRRADLAVDVRSGEGTPPETLADTSPEVTMPLDAWLGPDGVAKAKEPAWSFGGPGEELGAAVVSDDAGGVWLTGVFQDTARFGNTALTAKNLDSFIVHVTAAGVITPIGVGGNTASAVTRALAPDGAGGVWVAGTFLGTSIQVGDGSPLVAQNNELEAFVAHIDDKGKTILTKRIGGPDKDIATAVVVSGASVWVIGTFRGSVSFDAPSVSSAGAEDVFALRLDPMSLVAQQVYIGGGKKSDRPNAAVSDGKGGVWIVGDTNSPGVDFGTGAHSSKGGQDGFLLRVASTGKPLASAVYGGGGDETLLAIAEAPTGLWVGGSHTKTMTLGTQTLTATGFSDGFVAQIDTSSLSPTEVVSIDGTGVDAVYGLAFDNGNLWIVGQFGGTLGTLTTKDTGDGYRVRYAGGKLQDWHAFSGPWSSDLAAGVTVGPGGDVWVVGHYRFTADLGPIKVTAVNSSDVFLVGLR